ncbi:MAG TPA: sigma-54-dependent Fis family transcriptional regulator, partial [Pirellulaceae bacterium]|nr:sigma-54-dependent Fis family transcriptional regulator [Pirellulaceae bacterium]
MPDDVVVSTERGNECRLMLVNGPAPGEVVTLRDSGEGITIGRDSTADITLDDQLVSRHHARLRHVDGRWHVEDLGSRNGTRVNSQPIQTAVLNPGDVIRIGQRLLAFLGADQASADADEHAVEEDAGKTGMLRIAKPDMREGKFGAVLAKSFANDDSTARFLRCVSMLCRLATELHESPSIGHAARLTIASLRETIGAATVRVWLAGPSGRLRKVDDREEESSGAEDSHSATSTMDDQLFANLAVHQNEAILADGLPPPSADAVSANQKSPATPPAMRGLSMAVPIPGRSRPRGAIECRHASMITLRREEECPSSPIQASYVDAGFDRDDLELVIAVAHQLGAVCENLEHRERLERSNDELRERLRERSKIVGESRSIRDLLEQISRVAAVSSTVLIRGESGTGKELIAAALHDASPRSAGPFIAVNCAAFQESLLESELFGHEAGAFTGADRRRLGQFERAQKGTIFLDEVGELSASCQAKLLRVLEGHSFQRVG